MRIAAVQRTSFVDYPGKIAAVVFTIDASGDAVLYSTAEGGALGENYDTHNGSGNSAPLALTAYDLTAAAVITSMASAAATGDMYYLRLVRDGLNADDTLAYPVYLHGWLVQYTAEY